MEKVKEDKMKVVKQRMIAFNEKYLNTDEKGGKKVEKKKTLYDEMLEDEMNQDRHSGHGGHHGHGFRMGGGGHKVMYCANQ